MTAARFVVVLGLVACDHEPILELTPDAFVDLPAVEPLQIDRTLVLVDEVSRVSAVVSGTRPMFYRFQTDIGTIEPAEIQTLDPEIGAIVEATWHAPSGFGRGTIFIEASYEPTLADVTYRSGLVEVRQLVGQTTGETGLSIPAGSILAYPIELPANLSAHSFTISTTNTTPTTGSVGLYFDASGEATGPSVLATQLGPITFEGTSTITFTTTFTPQRLWLAFLTDEAIVVQGAAVDGMPSRMVVTTQATVGLPMFFPTTDASDVDFRPVAFVTVGPPPPGMSL
jgi:hypothetical protein